MNGVNMESSRRELAQALVHFPPIKHAFAYGSGVFGQKGALDMLRMVDYILVVDSPCEWHAHNLEQNQNHYSNLIRFIGPRGAVALAENVGAGVYFNSYVPWKNKLLKYGVIKKEALLEDLSCWSSLYVSGRMHKPVAHLIEDPAVMKANGMRTRHPPPESCASSLKLWLLEVPSHPYHVLGTK
ncbi:hypothetical protein CYMTET_10513 [Cymbomonas tetramitiformis]|uniref:Phosphatidate cytidylyltransferase, mitochondrial n=1 Tax=Cymbomonas tetramitiformis TaxID=36881 RepID=A0AAE0LDS7_9CHLO|nr:hypothetical protein CYMTET_10513 [Cymbomonas tetramitiformis]